MLLPTCSTASLAEVAAISVSSSSFSLFFLKRSSCSSKACLAFKAAARAKSAAWSASALRLAEEVEDLLFDDLFEPWCLDCTFEMLS